MQYLVYVVCPVKASEAGGTEWSVTHTTPPHSPTSCPCHAWRLTAHSNHLIGGGVGGAQVGEGGGVSA